MKKATFMSVCSLFLLFSCGGEGETEENDAPEKIDGAALAKEVCDCTTKANALPSDDPNRRAEQDKCMELQKTNWEKVKGNLDEESAFNDQFPCGM